MLKPSTDKQGIRLIDQKVPVSYIYLQEVLGKLAQDLKKRQLDPVLNTEQYKYEGALGVDGSDLVEM